jgi:hypothetical protein
VGEQMREAGKGGLGGITPNGSLMTCPEMHGELPIFKARYAG